MRGLTAWAVLLCSATASAYCPSYTSSSAYNTYDCGVAAVPGQNPTVAEWQAIFALVAQGPSGWGSSGPSAETIGQGCDKPTPPTQISAKFPCELLKALAMQESGWKQFCAPDRPADQVGKPPQTLISFDCGYGIGQVTSGMHVGESPSFDRTRVASDPTYNLATGTRILAGKWRATRCVGDNLPSVIEHWYSATWAYNGLAYVNNPTNPAFDSDRGVWNPKIGGAAPYQEKVFGWMEHPPSAGHWSSVAVAYPALGQFTSGGSPPALAEPSCASPTDCTRTRSAHPSACFPTSQAPDGGSGGSDWVGPGPTVGGDGSVTVPDLPLEPSGRPLPGIGGCGCQSGATPALLGALCALGVAALRRRRPGPRR